jgi:hypothetical protein
MRWFGEKWKGEVCEKFGSEQTPSGERCLFCAEPVEADDRGFIFDDGRCCHKKCLSRAVVGRTWVDHVWTSKMHSLWNRGWTCSRCGTVVFEDPDTKDGKEKNRRDRGVTDDCAGHLVDAISKL